MSGNLSYRHWLKAQARRRERIRKLAQTLPLIVIAKRFKISAARVSQIVNPK